jgi:hypothetical protein
MMRKAIFLISLLAVFCFSISAHQNFLSGTQTAPSKSEPQGSATSSQPVQQSIRGTIYDNATAHFTLTVPKDWVVSDALMKQLPGIVGALAAPGGSAAIMVQRYYVPGPKEGAKFLDSQFKNSFQDYRKLSEGPMKIDGKDGYTFTFHTLFPFGPPEKHVQIPVRLVIVLIPDGESVLGFTCQAPESGFSDFEPTLNAIVTSFRSNKH